jgi:hypothetical protein
MPNQQALIPALYLLLFIMMFQVLIFNVSNLLPSLTYAEAVLLNAARARRRGYIGRWIRQFIQNTVSIGVPPILT